MPAQTFRQMRGARFSAALAECPSRRSRLPGRTVRTRSNGHPSHGLQGLMERGSGSTFREAPDAARSPWSQDHSVRAPAHFHDGASMRASSKRAAGTAPGGGVVADGQGEPACGSKGSGCGPARIPVDFPERRSIPKSLYSGQNGREFSRAQPLLAGNLIVDPKQRG